MKIATILPHLRSELAAARACWRILCERFDERRWARQVRHTLTDADIPFKAISYEPRATMKPFERAADQHPLERILAKLEAAKPSAAILSMTGTRR